MFFFFWDAYVNTCIKCLNKNVFKSITEYLKVMRHERADQRKVCRPYTSKKKEKLGTDYHLEVEPSLKLSVDGREER